MEFLGSNSALGALNQTQVHFLSLLSLVQLSKLCALCGPRFDSISIR